MQDWCMSGLEGVLPYLPSFHLVQSLTLALQDAVFVSQVAVGAMLGLVIGYIMGVSFLP